MAVARMMEDHTMVTEVYYPGMDSHPNRDMWARHYDPARIARRIANTCPRHTVGWCSSWSRARTTTRSCVELGTRAKTFESSTSPYFWGGPNLFASIQRPQLTPWYPSEDEGRAHTYQRGIGESQVSRGWSTQLARYIQRQGLKCTGGSANIDEKIELPPAAATARGIYIYTVMIGMVVRGYDWQNRGDIVAFHRKGVYRLFGINEWWNFGNQTLAKSKNMSRKLYVWKSYFRQESGKIPYSWQPAPTIEFQILLRKNVKT